MKEEQDTRSFIGLFGDLFGDQNQNLGFVSPFQYIQSIQQMNRQKKCCVQKTYYESARNQDDSIRERIISSKINRKEILAWIRKMSLDEKFKLFIIQDDILSISIIKMYYSWHYNQINQFAKLNENSVNSFKFKQLLYDDISECFICRKQPQQESEAEKQLLDNIRIFDCVNFFDTICLSDSFLKDFSNVMKVFDSISGNSIFTSNCRVYWDQNEKTWSLDDPIWFNPNSFQTISSWIVSNIEKCIWIKFYNYQQTKYYKYSSENLEDQFCSLILENKFHLLKFWNKLGIERRSQIIEESRKDFNEQFGFNKNKKKHKVPHIYQKFKDKYIKTDVDEETMDQYFKQFLDQGKDIQFVDHLFFAQIEQTTSVYPFVFRIILKKLQYQFTSQLTDNLINNEKEKQKQVQKSRKKQKKNKKQKTENNCLSRSQTSSTTDDVERKSQKKVQKEINKQDDDDDVVDDDDDCSQIDNRDVDADDNRQIKDRVVQDTCSLNLFQQNSRNSQQLVDQQDYQNDFQEVRFNIKKDRKVGYQQQQQQQQQQEQQQQCQYQQQQQQQYQQQQQCQQQQQQTQQQYYGWCNKRIKGQKESINRGKKIDLQKMNSERISVQTKKEEKSSQGESKIIDIINMEDWDGMDQNKEEKGEEQLDSRDKNDQGYKKKVYCQSYVQNHDNYRFSSYSYKQKSQYRKPYHKQSTGFICNRKLQIMAQDSKVNTFYYKSNQGIQSGQYQKSLQSNQNGYQVTQQLSQQQNKEPSEQQTRQQSRKQDGEQNKEWSQQQSEKQDEQWSRYQNGQQNQQFEQQFVEQSNDETKGDIEIYNKKSIQVSQELCNEFCQELSENEQDVKIKFKKKVGVDKLYKKQYKVQFEESVKKMVRRREPRIKVVQEIRMKILKRINYLLPLIFENNLVQQKVYGSCMTNLSLMDSDIDICLSGFRNLQQGYIPKFLDRFLSVIKCFNWVQQYQQIYNTGVPLLKIRIDPFVDFEKYEYNYLKKQIKMNQFEKYRDMNVSRELLNEIRRCVANGFIIKLDITIDILSGQWSCGPHRHLGLISTSFINHQQQIYRCLNNFVIVFKNFLKVKGLNKSYTGGLSTYSLVILAVCMIKQLELDKNCATYQLIEHFIGYYSSLDFQSKQINLNFEYPIINNQHNNGFSIVNPFNQTQNIVLFNFGAIQDQLKILKNNLKEYQDDLKKKISKTEYSIIQEYLKNGQLVEHPDALQKIFGTVLSF